MAELSAAMGISVTHHFQRQLESFCRLERVSQSEARRLGKGIVERVVQARSENVIFSPSGCKVPVSVKLENGGIAKLLIVFDEAAPGSRAILRILSARMVRHGTEQAQVVEQE